MPFLAVLVFAATFVAVLYRIRQRVSRTGNWLGLQLRENVKAGPGNLSDVITIFGFITTIGGIVVSYSILHLQSDLDSVDAAITRLKDQRETLEEQIRNHSHDPLIDSAGNVEIHIEAPVGDVSVIRRDTPELRWQYARHTDRLDYVLEVIRTTDPSKLKQESRVPEDTCDFSRNGRCAFYATDPTSETSTIPLTSGSAQNGDELPSGDYLWRVAPAKARYVPTQGSTETSGPHDFASISEWSEYGSFSFYRTRRERITKMGRVLVGTSYAGDPRFSSIDGHGHNTGYDMDLIRLLVDGCVDFTPSGVTYDENHCQTEVSDYVKNAGPETEYRQSRSRYIEFRAFESVEKGLEALSRGEVDLFIAALTRAKERERSDVKLTKGYYTFHSALYRHGAESMDMDGWVKSAPAAGWTVGVIANSTNHWLATRLSGSKKYRDKLTVVPYPSYSELKYSFERRQVSSVLVDSVLGQSLLDEDPANVSQITGLEKTDAWCNYIDGLGFDGKEEFAIAVGVDPGDDERQCYDGRRCGNLWRAMSDAWKSVGDNGDLRQALERAHRIKITGTRDAQRIARLRCWVCDHLLSSVCD